MYNWSSSLERIKDGTRVHDEFTYRSDNNSSWMSKDELMDQHERNYIGKI